jgi:hypothetical protein
VLLRRHRRPSSPSPAASRRSPVAPLSSRWSPTVPLSSRHRPQPTQSRGHAARRRPPQLCCLIASSPKI